MTGTPGKLRMAAIHVRGPTELRGAEAGTAQSVRGPETQEGTGVAETEAVAVIGEEIMEAARGIMAEETEPVVEPREAMEEGTSLVEVRTGRVGEEEDLGRHVETKITTASTLHRRQRPGRSSRHQELCQAKTATTGSTATATVKGVIPAASVQVRRRK